MRSLLIILFFTAALTSDAQQHITTPDYRKLVKGYFVLDSLFAKPGGKHCEGFFFISDSVIHAISEDSCSIHAYFRWTGNNTFTLDRSKPFTDVDRFYYSFTVISYDNGNLQLMDFCEPGNQCPQDKQKYIFLKKRK